MRSGRKKAAEAENLRKERQRFCPINAGFDEDEGAIRKEKLMRGKFIVAL